MNIFKSKEIYKRIPGLPPESNPLRSVRGVYVSGERKDPYFIDHGISINSIKSNHVSIREYKDVYKTFNKDGFLKIKNIYTDTGSVQITRYSTTSTSANKDGFLKIKAIYTNQPFTIQQYMTINKSANKDGFLKIKNIYTDGNFNIERRQKLYSDICPSHLLTVTNYGCSQSITIMNAI